MQNLLISLLLGCGGLLLLCCSRCPRGVGVVGVDLLVPPSDVAWPLDALGRYNLGTDEPTQVRAPHSERRLLWRALLVPYVEVLVESAVFISLEEIRGRDADPPRLFRVVLDLLVLPLLVQRPLPAVVVDLDVPQRLLRVLERPSNVGRIGVGRQVAER